MSTSKMRFMDGLLSRLSLRASRHRWRASRLKRPQPLVERAQVFRRRHEVRLELLDLVDLALKVGERLADRFPVLDVLAACHDLIAQFLVRGFERGEAAERRVALCHPDLG